MRTKKQANIECNKMSQHGTRTDARPWSSTRHNPYKCIPQAKVFFNKLNKYTYIAISMVIIYNDEQGIVIL
jgi:hypothetical protein